MKTTHSLNLDSLKNAVRQIDKSEAKSIGQYTAAAMSKRIREGKTVDGEQLDPNSDSWENAKLIRGEIVDPLQQSGEMTRPTAFESKAKKNGFLLELQAQHQEKWDNIHEIVEETGKNWDRAWGIGDKEYEIMLSRYIKWLKRKVGLT